MSSHHNSKVELKLDWCSHAAAKWACEHWHYSGSMPTPPVLRIGVWEDKQYVGCVLFSRGANKHIGTAYGLECTEVCELTRVALSAHKSTVSRILKVAFMLLQDRCDGVRLIVSYADPNQGHAGGIYQASNWIYVGATPPSTKYKDSNGRVWHQRQVSKTGYKPQYGEIRKVAKIDECEKIPEVGKHKYLMPLDHAMREQIEPLRKPYPKRASVVEVKTPDNHSGDGGIKSDPDAPKID